jgi:beta-N-acetylhexosaminidase
MPRHPAASFPQITRRDLMRTGAAAATVAALGLPGRALAADLTPIQQAGQRVIFSYSGTTVPQGLLDDLAAGRAGGVIFFGDNISGLNQIDSAAQQLRAGRRPW